MFIDWNRNWCKTTWALLGKMEFHSKYKVLLHKYWSQDFFWNCVCKEIWRIRLFLLLCCVFDILLGPKNCEIKKFYLRYVDSIFELILWQSLSFTSRCLDLALLAGEIEFLEHHLHPYKTWYIVKHLTYIYKQPHCLWQVVLK